MYSLCGQQVFGREFQALTDTVKAIYEYKDCVHDATEKTSSTSRSSSQSRSSLEVGLVGVGPASADHPHGGVCEARSVPPQLGLTGCMRTDMEPSRRPRDSSLRGLRWSAPDTQNSGRLCRRLSSMP